jgi:hypothetical protein
MSSSLLSFRAGSIQGSANFSNSAAGAQQRSARDGLTRRQGIANFSKTSRETEGEGCLTAGGFTGADEFRSSATDESFISPPRSSFACLR